MSSAQLNTVNCTDIATGEKLTFDVTACGEDTIYLYEGSLDRVDGEVWSYSAGKGLFQSNLRTVRIEA